MIKLKDILKEAIIPNNMRIHASKAPITLQKKKYTQEDGMKPNGFWYGFGKEWINWTKTEMPEWAGKYIYEVGVSGNILKISTFEELLQFNKDFKTESSTGLSTINWKNVASKYDGIEIVPHQYKAKSNFTLLWYYGWDIGSGCIWNLGNTSLNLISK